MAVGEKIKCIISIEQIRYYKNNWGILEASLDKVHYGNPIVDKYNCFIVKGDMPEPKKGKQYHLTAIEIEDKNYGRQYEIVCIASSIDLDITDKIGQKQFLSTLFTVGQVKAMYTALADPFMSFNKGKIEDLVQIKGCGINNAPKWMDRFNQSLPLSKIYVELAKYNLTNNMIQRLLHRYRSADIVIDKVTKDPYVLCEVDGIGWGRADKIALEGGIGEFSLPRVKSFILHYLETQAQKGYSYITPSELMGAIIEGIGDEVSDFTITESIHDLGEQLWWNKDKSKIGLKKYRKLEENIGKELIRLLKAKNKFDYGEWEDIIRHKEHQQGWSYTEQQISGIKLALESQVIAVSGFAGTGKTSIVDGMLAVFKDYSFAQTALSGRAASRMAEVTKQEGFTIHRLLGYPDTSSKGKQKFKYHDENKLPYDIIILDEISMVDGYLFYYLIRSIKDGAKLIMLGDVGQLESIGCLNIAADIFNSSIIPSVNLTQIHRQAKDSAIITESKKVREGTQLIAKDWTGIETRGELQDLTIDCYSDKSNTFYKVMQHFSKQLENVKDIMDIQVIVPVKNTGDACTWLLNNAIQELYNPSSSDKDEIDVFYNKNQVGVLRLGDKVINTKNNYKTQSYVDEYKPSIYDVSDYEDDDNDVIYENITPIFNGNMGIVTLINKKEEYIVVDFSEVGEVVIPKNLLNTIELGYVCTCHKCQGSQWNRIIIGLDYSSFSLLTRELLNTALTRAKKHCTLVGQNTAIRYATMQNGVSIKQTHLVEILDELAHPKLIF